MAKFLILLSLAALGSAAPSDILAHGYAGYAGLAAAPVAVAAAPVTAVHETVHAGPAVSETVVHHGVVGSRTVQVGSQQVVAGHQYVVAGKTLEQQPAYSYVAGEAKSYSNTVPLAAPAIPAPAAPIIPGKVNNYGPAPADTVTQERIAAPVRTHTKITPQVRRIEPELQVNRYAVEVPVPNPVAVEKEVVYQTHVAKPYTVEVEQPYPVAQPYKVHPVHQVVETPVIEQTSYTVHQPIATAVQVQAAPVAVAHQGYAIAAEAAPVAIAQQGYAVAAEAAPVAVAHGYAGYAAAPVAIAAEAAPAIAIAQA